MITGLKRGRKKQLHPQQVLTPERIKEVVTNNLIQCGLCEIVIPANDEAKHLQVRHYTNTTRDNVTIRHSPKVGFNLTLDGAL